MSAASQRLLPKCLNASEVLLAELFSQPPLGIPQLGLERHFLGIQPNSLPAGPCGIDRRSGVRESGRVCTQQTIQRLEIGRAHV